MEKSDVIIAALQETKFTSRNDTRVTNPSSEIFEIHENEYSANSTITNIEHKQYMHITLRKSWRLQQSVLNADLRLSEIANQISNSDHGVANDHIPTRITIARQISP